MARDGTHDTSQMHRGLGLTSTAFTPSRCMGAADIVAEEGEGDANSTLQDARGRGSGSLDRTGPLGDALGRASISEAYEADAPSTCTGTRTHTQSSPDWLRPVRLPAPGACIDRDQGRPPSSVAPDVQSRPERESAARRSVASTGGARGAATRRGSTTTLFSACSGHGQEVAPRRKSLSYGQDVNREIDRLEADHSGHSSRRRSMPTEIWSRQPPEGVHAVFRHKELHGSEEHEEEPVFLPLKIVGPSSSLEQEELGEGVESSTVSG